MADAKGKLSFNKRYLVLVALFALAIYVILPQIGDFRSSWQELKHPEAGWLGLAVLLTGLTYLSAAATYYFLAFKPLRYFQTVLVELAVMFINRLLPGGVGALGGNYLYLHKKGHTPAQAGVMVATNNALGFVGHNALFLLVLVLSGGSVAMRADGGLTWLKYGAVLLAVLLVAGLFLGRRRLVKALKDFRTQLFEYRHRPGHLGLALLSSISLTAANVLALYACAAALGIHLGLAALFIVFSFGLGAATVTPTPGGLGGFEAGLVGGFVAYGVDSSTALAAALLYRIVSYWLPLAAGAIAFGVCQKRKLL